MKTIAVAGLQDEAAKSQFAARFAAECAKRGLGTLFVDMDQQALATKQLAQSAAAVASPVPASLFFNELAFQEKLVPDASSGRVVLAGADQGLKLCREKGMSAVQALESALDLVQQKFNLCVLCTSSSAAELAQAAQKTATWTMVPVFAEGQLSSLVLKSRYRVVTVTRSEKSTMESMCAAAVQALGLADLVSGAAQQTMGAKVEEFAAAASAAGEQAYFNRVYERLGSVQGMTAYAREEVKKELAALLPMSSEAAPALSAAL